MFAPRIILVQRHSLNELLISASLSKQVFYEIVSVPVAQWVNGKCSLLEVNEQLYALVPAWLTATVLLLVW